MKKQNNSLTNAAILRQKAEEQLKKQQSKRSLSFSEPDMLKLIHELEVHQIELEMQNEELVIAKEKAELAEEKYTELYDFAPSGYLSLLKDGEILELNFSAAKLLGKERSHLIKNLFGFFVFDVTLPAFNQFLQNVFKNKAKETCNVIISTAGNLPKYVQISGIVTENEEQCLINMIDVTDIKQAEEKLIKSENRYKMITSGLTDYIYTVNIKNNKTIETIHDETCLSVTGYTSQEFLNDTYLWYKIIVPEDRKFVVDKITQISHEKCILSFEHRIFCKNGQIRWIRNTLFPNFNPFGELTSYEGVIKDISELKQAEQNLKENDEILNQLLKNSPILIYLKDENIRAFRLSENFEQLVGIPVKQMLGKSNQELFPSDFAKKMVVDDLEILKNNNLIETVEELNGRFFTTIKFPIQINGNSRYLAGFSIDITDRKQAEQIIQQQNKELKKLNSDKDRFITILSHDLKSPFNSILGFLDLLTKNIRKYDIDKIEKQINIVNSSAKNTFRLLEDILLWVRANSGKIPFEPQKLNFATICNEVIENLKLTANTKDITIKQFATDEIYIFADINMLNTVLRNIVSNSIKFTNKGGRIDIYAEKNHLNGIITISDNGVGIEPDKINKLFDISQINSRNGTENEKGTGLGLLLCKEFVEKHSGQIWVESEIGKGSDFKFTMPLCNDR